MELSEEEIIRNVKRIIEYKVISNYINNYDCRVIQGLLDLYYKQQKEIEELKQNRDEYKEEYKKLLNARYYDYISKDKIKELKEKVEKEMISNPYDFSYMINELLEEK